MATDIYAGRESDIEKAHHRRDRKERVALRKELGIAIKRHLKEVEFWDDNPEPSERIRYIRELSSQGVLRIYLDIHLLVLSLEEAQQGGQMWPEAEQGPHGFTLWIARLGRRLGSRSCNGLGRKMCEDAGFTVAKGHEILAALEPSFRKAKEESERRR